MWWWLLAEIVVLCGVFFFGCYQGTGSDEKNIKSYGSYPDEIQAFVREQPQFKGKIKVSPWYITFLSNVIVFSILFFVLILFIHGEGFLTNFLLALVMGQALNLFDFLVIDLIWWRHSPRVRFTGTEDRKELYLSPKKHFYAFLRGAAAFLVVAVIDGLLLSLL